MALLTEIEAAVRLGVSVELLTAFSRRPITPGSVQVLATIDVNGERMFEEKAVESFGRFLREPWPLPKKGKRPHIPDAIKRDIQAESHFGCAICGWQNGTEIAHIQPVHTSLDNSPENLLNLCPNHHTSYDYGYFASGTGQDIILAAKLSVRSTRARIMKCELNTVQALKTVLGLAQSAQTRLAACTEHELAKQIESELDRLITSLPQIMQQADEAARQDKSFGRAVEKLRELSPNLVDFVKDHERSAEKRALVEDLFGEIEAIELDLGEVVCPHCSGIGTIGLVGDYCLFCGGSCYVPDSKAALYNPDTLDEVSCPRCDGRGLIGLCGDYCSYCHGSCMVSKYKASSFIAEELDEVECPHCGGSGQIGYGGGQQICEVCHGLCVVTSERADSFDENDLSRIQCPRCEGTGKRGFSGDYCLLCNGGCFVKPEQASDYEENGIDEEDCPHCQGRGQLGLVGEPCGFCRGSCSMPLADYEKYNPDDFDEVECPRCAGRGTTGLVLDICALCRGNTFVSARVASEYSEKYGDG